jgi:hypothetical protein
MANSEESAKMTEAETETAYLLKSSAMRRRLMEAMKRQEGLSLEDVCERLGIDPSGGE